MEKKDWHKVKTGTIDYQIIEGCSPYYGLMYCGMPSPDIFAVALVHHIGGAQHNVDHNLFGPPIFFPATEQHITVDRHSFRVKSVNPKEISLEYIVVK